MLTFPSRKAFLICSLFLSILGTVQAEPFDFTIPEEVFELKPNKHALINARTQRSLERAWASFEGDKVSEALSKLQHLANETKQNPVAISHILYSASQMLAQQAQYDPAILLIKQLLRLDSLNEDLLTNQTTLLAQLLIQESRFKEAITVLQTLISAIEPGKPGEKAQPADLSEWYYLFSYSLYQSGEYQQAIESAKQALNFKGVDKEALYQIQLNSLLAIKNYKASKQVSKKLVTLKPENKSYWQQWVRINLQLKDTQDALSGFELIRKQHSLEPDETLHYAQLLMQEGSPIRAAKILDNAWQDKVIERSARNLLLLGYSWEQAGNTERAIDLLRTSQFITNYQDSKDGINCLQLLIQLLSKNKSWPKIASLIEQISNNSIKVWLDTSEPRHQETTKQTKFWIAIEYARALFYMNKLDAARKSFLDIEDNIAAQTENASYAEISAQLNQWKTYFAQLGKHKPKT